MPIDYSKGKIYQIVDYTNDNVYIGSTCEITLAKRLAKHVGDYKRYLNGKGNYITSYKVLENGNYDILLIENFACESKDELHKREGFHIKNALNCINKRIEGRTDAQYRQDNKKIILEKAKQYYDEKKEIISEQRKQYYEDHKKEIKEYQKQKTICVCGSETTIYQKARHERTQKHKSFIEAQKLQPI